MSNPKREFITAMAQRQSRFPESAWYSMLGQDTVGAVTVERFDDLVYDRIIQQMEQYDGIIKEKS